MDPLPKRKPNRLAGYDYSQSGAYFITICAKGRHTIFGTVCVGRDDLGAPRSSRPTKLVPRIVAALKRFTNKEAGLDLWQASYHDHIVRSEADYLRIWSYIDTNPAKWREDCYYTETEG